MAKEFPNITFQVVTQSKSMSLWQETDLIKKKTFRVVEHVLIILTDKNKLWWYGNEVHNNIVTAREALPYRNELCTSYVRIFAKWLYSTDGGEIQTSHTA